MTRALRILIFATLVAACQQLPLKAERGPLCLECPVTLDLEPQDPPRAPTIWDVIAGGALAVAIGHVLNAIVSR